MRGALVVGLDCSEILHKFIVSLVLHLHWLSLSMVHPLALTDVICLGIHAMYYKLCYSNIEV
jgi:hypothetical protein